jgi:mRNA interferase MazF
MIRGEVYRVRPPRGTGHARQGSRFGVVVQANELLPRSVVLIAPTSRSARPASFRPEIDVAGQRTRVLVEQVGAIDVARIGELVRVVSPEEAWGIDEALRTVLGLR